MQGWSSFTPTFVAVDFVSFYIEIPVMIVMYVGWVLLKRAPKLVGAKTGDQTSPLAVGGLDPHSKSRWHDLVDTKSVDLKSQEYEEVEEDRIDDATRQKRLSSRAWCLWRVYYWVV